MTGTSFTFDLSFGFASGTAADGFVGARDAAFADWVSLLVGLGAGRSVSSLAAAGFASAFGARALSEVEGEAEGLGGAAGLVSADGEALGGAFDLTASEGAGGAPAVGGGTGEADAGAPGLAPAAVGLTTASCGLSAGGVAASGAFWAG